MRHSRQVSYRGVDKIRRASAIFAAVLMMVSLVTMFYQPPAEAGVTTWPGDGSSTAISAGSTHTCAIISSASVYCWGGGGDGQLGHGSTADSLVPVAVSQGDIPSGATVQQISSGYHHTCAIASNGWAYCWGSRANGRLGDGSSSGSRTTPVSVSRGDIPVGATILQIAAGQQHTCAIASDGKAYCWGDGAYGRLGNGSTSQQSTPVAISQGGMTPGAVVQKISAGVHHTCGITSGGLAYCWGHNNSSQLGDGSTNDQHTPIAVSRGDVPMGDIFLNITTGWSHTCAVTSGNWAYCWGSGGSGRLGSGATSDEAAPSAVLQGDVPSGVVIKQVSVGASHTCAAASDNKAYCWGSGGEGRIGNGWYDQQNVPEAVAQGEVPLGATVSQIAAGNSHTCVIAGGQTFCWGSNTNGRLGNNSTSHKASPTAVRSLNTPLNTSSYRLYKNANSAAPGDPLAGVDAPGQLATAGEDFRLRQGINNGIFDSPVGSNEPTITAISTGLTHTCAIANGQAYCWGSNFGGQLGNGSTVSSNIPVAVDASGVLAGKTVTDISASWFHTCAIADDQAYCWGFNMFGSLGDNSSHGSQSNVPVAVASSGVLAGKAVTAISAGMSHVCVIADSQSYCWGENIAGQLGNGSTVSSNVPVAVSTTGALSGKTVTDISVGINYSCAIASDGWVYCWGADSDVPEAISRGAIPSGATIEQLSLSKSGNSGLPLSVSIAVGSNGAIYLWVPIISPYPSTLAAYSLPTGVTLKQGVVGAQESGMHACALGVSGQAYCSGSNSNGQRGDGTIGGGESSGFGPVEQGDIPNGVAIKQLATGSTHTCGVADGQAYCWGDNTHGQLGNNSTAQSLVPAAIDTSNIFDSESEAVTSSGAVISTGAAHNCAITDGWAYCWGNGNNGRVGDGTGASVNSTPVAVARGDIPAGATIRQVSSGTHHTCAVVSNGWVYCWGLGDDGRLGDGSTSGNQLTPTAISRGNIPAGATILHVAAGSTHSCVIASDNKAYCWGSGADGRLGNGSTGNQITAVAVSQGEIPNGVTIRNIETLSAHTCTIASDSKAYCWGNGSQGRLGSGSTSNQSTPVAVRQGDMPTGATFRQVTVGYGHSCAIASDHKTYCWGASAFGRLGSGSSIDQTTPVAVLQGDMPAGATIIHITAGEAHTCAVASDNRAYCWGNGDHGRLGRGSIGNQATPVAVSQGAMPANTDIVQVAAGSAHSCAFASSGQVFCWGWNSGGRLGNNSTSDSFIPVAANIIISIPPVFKGTAIIAGANNFILQYATLSSATCSLQTTSFAEVTASTPIAYNANAGVASGSAITTSGDDPTGSDTTAPQTYLSSAGAFTNTSDIPPGHTGLFDFSLKDNGAASGETYCLRIAYGDGSPIEGATAYAEVTIANGMLFIGIFDNSLSPVTSPSFAMTPTTVQPNCQSVTGTFSTDSQFIGVVSTMRSTGWSINTAATNGPTAAWASGENSYDFNDPSGSPPGCNSGSDGDGLAGQLSFNPTTATVTPGPGAGGCDPGSLSRGGLASFSQGALDSITLLTAPASTSSDCIYIITGVEMLQYIPANQPAGNYSIDMTTTVVAQ